VGVCQALEPLRCGRSCVLCEPFALSLDIVEGDGSSILEFGIGTGCRVQREGGRERERERERERLID
jgi:hypothetical protein